MNSKNPKPGRKISIIMEGSHLETTLGSSEAPLSPPELPPSLDGIPAPNASVIMEGEPQGDHARIQREQAEQQNLLEPVTAKLSNHSVRSRSEVAEGSQPADLDVARAAVEKAPRPTISFFHEPTGDLELAKKWANIAAKARPQTPDGSRPGPEPRSAQRWPVTVLTAGSAMRKTFSLDPNGVVKSVSYDKGFLFEQEQITVSGIKELGSLVQRLSQEADKILIRGTPAGPLLPAVRRLKENFPEAGEGCPWAMLDFDDIPLPEGLSPIDPAAIEFLISKLPPPFHEVSYFYQFSSSAGILNAEGSLRKAGTSAHIFFWFNRPISGIHLEGYLRRHCLQTGFFEKKLNSAGMPYLSCGVDGSVLKSSVQPHYVALPLIGEGVKCILQEVDRQRFVDKASPVVTIEPFGDEVIDEARQLQCQFDQEWKQECGYQAASTLTKRAGSGVEVAFYYRKTGAGGTNSRPFESAEVRTIQKAKGGTAEVATLYFAGESSPGSWRVFKDRPLIARRFGDNTTAHLKELSLGAYNYIRNELKWFAEVEHAELSLLNGYLPPLASFVKARRSLVLAPTGSGKTKAFCDFAFARQASDIIIYAAQTISLTRQMEADLKKERVPVIHYSDFYPNQRLEPGVYVTTNESLKKIIKSAQAQGSEFILVIDEAHIAIDDFMRSELKNRLLDDAVLRAKQTIFMTGTLTALQRQKIADVVSQTPGGLGSDNFVISDFPPTKAHPLLWADQRNFDTDLLALMRSHQALKTANQPLPRIAVIVPTSSMRRYELMLDLFGLKDEAMVVSREEATQEDIELARTSNKPWLISSPLFAIGLNFEFAPTRLWTTFGKLAVDTSQIIQTVNRANRTPEPCEVRLYAGRLDPLPYHYLEHAREREQIETFFLDESEIAGILDPHYQLDRITYNEIRSKQEKDTAKSLFELYSTDSVQNYRILDTWDDNLPHDDDDDQLVQQFAAQARQSYKADVAAKLFAYEGGSADLLLYQLQLQKARRNFFWDQNLVPKDITDEELAIGTALTKNLEHLSKSAAPDGLTLLRLHGDKAPFVSGQFSQQTSSGMLRVASEKIRDMVSVIDLLEDLRNGKVDGVSFGKKMRHKIPKKGVLALVNGDSDYVAWNKALVKLDQYQDEYVGKASKARRAELDVLYFKEAQKFLKRLGVTFGKRSVAGHQRIDPAKPIVPDWNWQEMRVRLHLKAESLENLPPQPIDLVLEDRKWTGSLVSLATCRTCVHGRLDKICEIGRPVETAWNDGLERTQVECDGLRPLPRKIQQIKDALEPRKL